MYSNNLYKCLDTRFSKIIDWFLRNENKPKYYHVQPLPINYFSLSIIHFKQVDTGWLLVRLNPLILCIVPSEKRQLFEDYLENNSFLH